jgi:LysM repeat protein
VRRPTTPAAVVLVALAVAVPAASADSYHVRPGDTLTAIAHAHGTSVLALARLNQLAPNGTLLAGAVLQLPPPKATLEAYRVQPGDSLTAISERFHTTVGELARINRIDPAGTLLIGKSIRVPTAGTPRSGATYTVRPGDTLSAIAFRYEVSLGALADLNRLALADPLPIGKRLELPAQKLASSLRSFPRSTVRGSIVFWSDHYGVDAHLASALAWMESGFNNSLVSAAGAVGVMQITPDTWDYVEQVLLLGQAVPHDQDGNVRIGVAYLHHLLHLYGGDERSALAAYYQGARALQTAGLFPGTKQYVDDILALKQRF